MTKDIWKKKVTFYRGNTAPVKNITWASSTERYYIISPLLSLMLQFTCKMDTRVSSTWVLCIDESLIQVIFQRSHTNPHSLTLYTAARNGNFPKSFHTWYTYQHLVENRMFIASYWNWNKMLYASCFPPDVDKCTGYEKILESSGFGRLCITSGARFKTGIIF